MQHLLCKLFSQKGDMNGCSFLWPAQPLSLFLFGSWYWHRPSYAFLRQQPFAIRFGRGARISSSLRALLVAKSDSGRSLYLEELSMAPVAIQPCRLRILLTLVHRSFPRRMLFEIIGVPLRKSMEHDIYLRPIETQSSPRVCIKRVTSGRDLLSTPHNTWNGLYMMANTKWG